MKTRSVFMTVMLLLSFAALAMAQPGRGAGQFRHEKGMGMGLHRPDVGDDEDFFSGRMLNALDLTDEQTSQLKELRTKFMKEVLPLRNELQEKHAQLRTLSTGDNVDMNKVNQTIDQIGAITTKLMKQRAAHRQEVRKILTEDQRVKFDSMPHPGLGFGGPRHMF